MFRFNFLFSIDTVSRVTTRLLTFLLIAPMLSSVCSAQYRSGQALSDYVHSNEKFGRKLLLAVHEADQEKNIAISPFPLSQAFGALSEGTFDSTTRLELANVFEWKDQPFRDIASRMLSARIPAEKLHPNDETEARKPSKGPPPVLGPGRSFVPLSQSTTFLYRGKGFLRDSFIEQASRDYGIQFQEAKPGELPVPKDPDVRKMYELKPGILDFSITTFTDLRTAWRHDLFNGRSQKLTFTLRSGLKVETDQMVSTLQHYQHVSTDEYEAVELPCGGAYLLVLVPAIGKDILDLEREFATGQINLDSMPKSEEGDVTLPIFHMRFSTDLLPPLRKLGLNTLFTDFKSLGAMVSSPEGARLTTTVQRVDLDVDTWGIKARAITFLGGVLGGVMGGSMLPPPQPFHMIVNRPFLFFVRDNVTDALLFAGAEMNPTAN
jgi:serine protease inhibitor